MRRVVNLRSELDSDPAVVSSMPTGRPGGTLADFELRFIDNNVTQYAQCFFVWCCEARAGRAHKGIQQQSQCSAYPFRPYLCVSQRKGLCSDERLLRFPKQLRGCQGQGDHFKDQYESSRTLVGQENRHITLAVLSDAERSAATSAPTRT